MRKLSFRFLFSLAVCFLFAAWPCPAQSPFEEEEELPKIQPGKIASVSLLTKDLGPCSMPSAFGAYVTVTDRSGNICPDLKAADFAVKIGEKTVNGLMAHFTLGKYVLICNKAPEQSNDGIYDVFVSVKNETGIIDSRKADGSAAYARKKIDVVFMIDCSGSMRQNDKNNLRIKSLEYFMDTFAPSGVVDRIAVVGFTEKAELMLPMTHVSEKETIRKVLASIKATTDTDIGAAIKTAYGAATADKPENAKVALLLTDGVNDPKGRNPEISYGYNNEHDLFGRAMIPIHTIALSNSSDKALLKSIASSTGGQYYSAPDAEYLQSVFGRFSAFVGGREIITDTSAGRPLPAAVKVPIDPSLADVVFSVETTSKDTDSVILTSPSNKRFNFSDRGNFSFIRTDRYIIITAPVIETGTWEVSFRDTSSVRRMSVQGRSNLRLKPLFLQLAVGPEEPLKITALFGDDSGPVAASVNAEIFHESETAEVIACVDLHDDGLHADGEPGDGIYSNFYFEKKKPGKYGARIMARGGGAQERVRETIISFDVIEDKKSPFNTNFEKLDFSSYEPGRRRTGEFSLDSLSGAQIGAGIIILPVGGSREIPPVFIKPIPPYQIVGKSSTFKLYMKLPSDWPIGRYSGKCVIDSSEGLSFLPLNFDIIPRSHMGNAPVRPAEKIPFWISGMEFVKKTWKNHGALISAVTLILIAAFLIFPRLKKPSSVSLEVYSPETAGGTGIRKKIFVQKTFKMRLITIGKSDDNDIVLSMPPHSDPVSRKHAYIIVSGSRITLYDAGSKNGTFVNGKAVKKCAVGSEDIIVIGPFEIKVDLLRNGGAD